MILRLRDVIGEPELPFIAGQMGKFPEAPWGPAAVLVDQAYQNLPKHIPHTAFVSSAGLVDKGDKVHFDAASYREFGKRYAQAYLKDPEPDETSRLIRIWNLDRSPRGDTTHVDFRRILPAGKSDDPERPGTAVANGCSGPARARAGRLERTLRETARLAAKAWSDRSMPAGTNRSQTGCPSRAPNDCRPGQSAGDIPPRAA